MLLPILPLESVCHVGAFAGYAPRFSSLEANALSVSLCPDAWRAIARIGEAPVWRLDKPGGRFLDALAIDADGSQALANLAVARGLARHQTLWRVSWWDDEVEDRRAFEFLHEDEARAELGETGEDGLDRRLERHVGLQATDALRRRVGAGPEAEQPSDLVFDLFLQTLAEDLGLDGVYWRETYAPEYLSAPRGAIPQPHVPGFAAVRLDPSEVPDDEELLETLPEPILTSFDLAPAAADA